MDWDRLRTFYTVAKVNSFTKAVDHLSLNQSSISRQIGALEDEISAPLFFRHARGLVLTEQGEILFHTVRDVFSKLAMTEAILSESFEAPRGILRIATTTGFGSLWLAPRIKEFAELYPELRVFLMLVDKENDLDLSIREADLLIRTSATQQDGLIKIPFLTSGPKIYSSAAYLAQHGIPQVLSDLDHHQLITFSDDTKDPSNWLLNVGADPQTPRTPFLCINNTLGILRAVQEGNGIAALPDYVAGQKSALVQIHLDIKEQPAMLQRFLVYPEQLLDSNRVSVFRNFLLSKVLEEKL